MKRKKNKCLICLFSGGSSKTLAISTTSKINEQISKRQKVTNVDGDSEALTGSIKARRNKQVTNCQGHTNQELSDLNRGQVTLSRRMQTDGGSSIVTVHDGMDERVE